MILSGYRYVLALYTFCRLTESKFVVYDVIGRNMFLNLSGGGVFSSYFTVFRDVLLSLYFL